MGYTKRENTSITDFWPDNTDTEIYIESSSPMTISDLIDIAKDKWPHASFLDIKISSEKIHTSCIYYDLYDPIDYTDFLILSYTKKVD